MDGGIREGTAKEILIDSLEYDPAEGGTPEFVEDGYAGAVKAAGNKTMYSESNYKPGSFKHDLSCTPEQYHTLAVLQSSRRSVSVAVTDAGGTLWIGKMYVSNTDRITLNNGVVSLEMAGQFAPA